MPRIICSVMLVCFSVAAFSQPGALRDRLLSKKVTLPNGWSLTPAGSSFQLGDLPLNIAVSQDTRWLAVTNNGQSTQSIELIDACAHRVVDSVVIAKSWLGLKFGADDRSLYASAGNDNMIIKYAIAPPPQVAPSSAAPDAALKQHWLTRVDSFVLGSKWPVPISPAGFDIDEKRRLLYVVTKENNDLYIVDLVKHTVLDSIPIGGEGYTCLLSHDARELYLTCWGCDKLRIFDTRRRAFTGEIAVGDNPNDLCLTNDGRTLFVANANDNSISVVDIKSRKILETLNAALYPDAPPGSTTNALALDADNKNLYVANADNNCLAVFDVSKPGAGRSKGYIPVGWYPTAVRVVGKEIWVANGKGFSSMANPWGPNPVNRREVVNYQHGDNRHMGSGRKHPDQYIAGLFKGTMSVIDQPDENALGIYSALVYQNTPYTKEGEKIAKGEAGNPIPMRVGDPSPIKYVFYIIKENRTYDQVLGDQPEGNGDTSLVLFGDSVTPNQHALTRQFVLCDNFYVDAEVSADGHNWSMGAYADDYLEKTWPTYYGSRGGTYSSEGTREIANNKGGFVWDDCRRAGVTYRTYGEFADEYKPNIPTLADHFCPYYTGWDLGVRDTVRFRQWKRDFDSLLAAGALPHFNTLRFGNDHTEGMRKGKPSPFAFVADNDLAVGEFVEYLSKSPIWKESVVFILEDDAQNGPDHVDAHRSPVYMAGGMVKRHFVDHSMYSTTSVLRTIELILGMAPMSQYDAAANPMWRCFSPVADNTPFVALPEKVDLNEINPAGPMAHASARLDFGREDRVPDNLFNEILWKGIRGTTAKVPAPRHAAFVKATASGDDDDD